MKGNFYNENDPYAAAWLRELIADGLIPKGTVDERSITELKASDLEGFTQVHLFCGISGWPLALRLAGWPDDAPIFTGSCPCFPAGTLIVTSEGWKNIEDVQVGELVLTHRGRWRRVLQTGSEIASCVTVKGQGHFGLTCTPDHPFYVGNDEWEGAAKMKGRRWATIRNMPPVEIPEILSKRGYFWDKNSNGFRVKGEKGGQPVYVALCDTEDEARKERATAITDGRITVRGADAIQLKSLGVARFLGYWLGDGWVSGDSVFLCGAKTDCGLLNELFHGAGLPGRARLERTSSRIRVGSQSMVRWITEQFGRFAHAKKIPIWLYGMPADYRAAFLDGYMLADGHHEVQSKGGGKIKCYTTTSKMLAVGVRVLLNQVGISASITTRKNVRKCVIQGRHVNERQCYKVTAYESARSFQFDDQYGWGVVRSINDAGQQRVYNIAVEEDESYTADGIVVHNCPPFSVAGKKKLCPKCGGKPIPHPYKTGIFACVPCGHEWFADGRHLWPEFYRLIAECRPAIVVGEQVSGADGVLWFTGVRATLERIRYGVGAVDLPAAGVRAPNIRQRLFWCANRLAHPEHAERRPVDEPGQDVVNRDDSGWSEAHSQPGACGEVRGLADASSERRQQIPGGASSHETADGGTGRDRLESNGDHESASDGQDVPGICPRCKRKCECVAFYDDASQGYQCTEHGYFEEGPTWNRWRASWRDGRRQTCPRSEQQPGEPGQDGRARLAGGSKAERLADTPGRGLGIDGSAQRPGGHADERGETARLVQPNSAGPFPGSTAAEAARHRDTVESASGWMGESIQPGLEGHTGNGHGGNEPGRHDTPPDGPTAEAGAWSDYRIVLFTDGKTRRIGTGIEPLVGRPKPSPESLASRVSPVVVPGSDPSVSEAQNTAEARVIRLKGYGNALCIPVAVAFIRASMDAINDLQKQENKGPQG